MKPGLPGNMSEHGQRIAYLVAGFIRHTLTEKEHDELDAWINESDENMKLFEEWTDDDHIQANLEWMDKINSEKSFKRLQAQGAFQSPKKIWSWSVAASLLLVIAASSIFLFKNYPATNPQTITSEKVVPGSMKATLEYGNNQLVDLGSPNKIIVDSGIIQEASGLLVYHSTKFTSTQVLRVPIGGKYQLVLSDSTKIWLNSGTKLVYPDYFDDTVRKVQLTGEAYFEVSKNNKQPFIVEFSKNFQIRALGTSFDIKYYTNESVHEITLLEGSVLVTRDIQQTLMKPGEQFRLAKTKTEKVLLQDPKTVIGWKQDLFIFNRIDLETMMRQLERWYGITTVYETRTTDPFTCTFEKNQPLTEILTIIEKSSKISFRIKDKTVYISKKNQ